MLTSFLRTWFHHAHTWVTCCAFNESWVWVYLKGHGRCTVTDCSCLTSISTTYNVNEKRRMNLQLLTANGWLLQTKVSVGCAASTSFVNSDFTSSGTRRTCNSVLHLISTCILTCDILYCSFQISHKYQELLAVVRRGCVQINEYFQFHLERDHWW